MHRIIAYILILSAAFCLTAAAQTSADGEASYSKNPPLFQKVDVDFKGGTISDFLRAIQDQSGVTPNVIVSKEAASLGLPAISLRSVEISSVVMALEDLNTVDGCLIEVSSSTGDIMTIGAIRQRPRDPNMSRAFNIEKKLAQGAFKVDDLVTSIETALDMQTENPSTQLKYHQETGLLIAAGPREEINTVENILYTLMEDEASSARKETADALRKEITDLKEAVKALREECNMLKKQIVILMEDK
jgi:hypothetical protein